ncbi:glutamate--tRNA ligase [candidate division KSB1 bacterium]|nr:glutamate--tRNA ligase [candidate division KSB1 bacterium]
MNKDVRVRFAPSPTGHLHIGNARTAILNWLFAKHTSGKFILRIEDTDPERSKEEYTEQIYSDLQWLGLAWDEGPDVGGDYGPYKQSERLDIYARYTMILLEKGLAYKCFCTPEELEIMRKEAIEKGLSANYDRRCLHLSPEEIATREAQGLQAAIRFKVPEKDVVMNDLVKKQISFPYDSIGDFVIMRKEGIPTYNYAAVVDDHLMEITHVIRGDDHVSNTPKQILLYEAFGFEIPEFAHIPMILGPDRLRLSKRHGATSIDEYQARGYLPEALINFLSLLSWSSESGAEILSKERLIQEFDFNRVTQSAAVFNHEKLNWMNGSYIRESRPEELIDPVIPFFIKAGYPVDDRDRVLKIIKAVQEKIDYLEQIIDHAKIFFQDSITIEDAEARALVRKETSQKVFWSFLRELRAIDHIDMDTFRLIMKTVQKETGVMGKDLWMPIRIGLTGRIHGPELPMIVELLGKQTCQKFIEEIVNRFS